MLPGVDGKSMSFSVSMILPRVDLKCLAGLRLLYVEYCVTEGMSQLMRADTDLVLGFFLSVDSSVA